MLLETKNALRELLHPSKIKIKCRYSLAHATVKQGESSTPHALKTTGVYYILEGKGVIHIDEESEKVHTGDVVYIPQSAKQFIANSGKTDLKFPCIVDPAWQHEDEVVF